MGHSLGNTTLDLRRHLRFLVLSSSSVLEPLRRLAMSVLLMQFQSELGQFSHTAGLLLGGSRPELRTVLVLTIRQEAFLHFQEGCSVVTAGCAYSTKQKPYPERMV